MATLQNIGKLKYRGKDGQWHPLPVVVQDTYGGVSTISGNGAPTSATQGKVNQLYRNEDTQKLYICTATAGGYTWAAVVSDTEDAVTYTAQTLTEEQKTQARANIGAGTSNFSGSYNDLNDQPNIPAATVIDTTLSKSGQAADAKAAGDAIEKKIDAPQVAKVGEVLTVEEVDAEGKPKKWKAAPAAAEQKQADWAQNDDTAADYVKNRPFYSEKTKVTAVDAHIDTPLSTNGELSAYLIPEESINYEYLDVGLLFIDGETYDVYLDSSLYRLQAKRAGGNIILGNASIMLGTGEDTGEPFAVGMIQALGGLIIVTNTGSHDLAIKRDWTTVHKIDGMYYDKSLIFGSNIDGIVPDSIFVSSEAGTHKIGELQWVRQYDEEEGVYTEYLAAYGLNYAVRGYYLYDINNPTLVKLPTNVGDSARLNINGDRNEAIGNTDANLNIINLKIKENDTTSDSIGFSFINQSLKDGSVTYSTVFYRDGKLYGVEIHGNSIALKRLI